MLWLIIFTIEFSKVINSKTMVWVWDHFTKKAQHQKDKCNTILNITGGQNAARALQEEIQIIIYPSQKT